MSRPVKFTQEIFEAICETIATTSRGIHSVCKEHGVGVSQFFKLMRENSELSQIYTRAREAQADLLADEILEIADNTENDNKGINGSNAVQRDRLRIDSRKFLAAKLKPKKYSERIDITSDGEAIKPIDLSSIVSNFVNNKPE